MCVYVFEYKCFVSKHETGGTLEQHPTTAIQCHRHKQVNNVIDLPSRYIYQTATSYKQVMMYARELSELIALLLYPLLYTRFHIIQ